MQKGMQYFYSFIIMLTPHVSYAVFDHQSVQDWLGRQPQVVCTTSLPTPAAQTTEIAYTHSQRPFRSLRVEDTSATPSLSAGEIKKIIGDALAENTTRFPSSKGQDIGVVIGRTGAGKSTLLNYLAGHSLTATRYQAIDLAEGESPSALPIGMGGVSKTRFPQAVQIGDLRVYDLPGFHDTEGTPQNLVNAAFIKQILGAAKSLRLIFVVGQEEIIAGRGALFAQLIDISSTLFGELPLQTMSESSLFVVTKSQYPVLEDHHDYLMNMLGKKTQGHLDLWRHKGNALHMPKPFNGEVSQHHRQPILEALEQLVPYSPDTIDISVLHPYTVKDQLMEIFHYAFKETMEADRAVSATAVTREQLEGELERWTDDTKFWADFEASICTKEEYALLRGLDEQVFACAFEAYQKNQMFFFKTEIENLHHKRAKLIAELFSKTMNVQLEKDLSFLAQAATFEDLDRELARLSDGARFWSDFEQSLRQNALCAPFLPFDEGVFGSTFTIFRENHAADLKIRLENLDCKRKELSTCVASEVAEISAQILTRYIATKQSKLTPLDADVKGYNSAQAQSNFNILKAAAYNVRSLSEELQKEIQDSPLLKNILDEKEKRDIFTVFLSGFMATTAHKELTAFCEKIEGYKNQLESHIAALESARQTAEADRKAKAAQASAEAAHQRAAEAEHRERLAQLEAREREAVRTTGKETEQKRSQELECIYQKGCLYGARGIPLKAWNLWMEAANGGHAAAQHMCARKYDIGWRFVQKDKAEALGFYKKAAAQGYAPSQVRLRELMSRQRRGAALL